MTLVASGAIRALSSGAEARSTGGAGGAGGRSRTSDLVDTTQGGAGGNGGMGGTVSLQWLSGTVQTTGFGLRATAVGGSGGNGGIAGDDDFGSLNPSGGDGGAGGNGGTAGVLLSGGAITVTQIAGCPVTGILVDANGGDGGAGGVARTGTSTGGGNGGNGGSGGTASATILGTVILNGSAGVGQTSGQAVLVQANGGGGGQGGQQRLGDRPSRWRRVCGRRR